MQQSNFSVDSIDFISPAFIADPYPFYDLMRSEAPILHRPDWKLTFLTAYEDVNVLLRDRRLGRSILHRYTREELGWPEARADYAAFDHMNANMLMDQEPPDHTRLKTLVHHAFTPARVRGLHEQAHMIATRLIDEAVPAGAIDLLEGFATPLSVTMISDLLGVPEQDRHQLRPWSADIVAMYELGEATDEVARQATQAVLEFSAYLRELIASRREHPQADLLSALVEAEAEGERLTEDELIATAILILNAGHEATVNALGNGMLAFAEHPEQYQLLREKADTIPTAIEEILRYDTPLPFFDRWVLEDFSYKGHEFKVGEKLAFMLGAANRDPAHFPDAQRFDITRKDNPHLSFGMGVHYCLGAPLARMELQVALSVLVQRLPELRITGPIERLPTFAFRGLKALPVAL